MNYHLKALERHGLVELVEERRKGNVTERVLRASAASYLISPVALQSVAPDPHRFADRFSAFWLLALAGRMVQEMGKLIAGVAAARQKLATFAIDGEIHLSYRRGPGRLRRRPGRGRHRARGQVPPQRCRRTEASARRRASSGTQAGNKRNNKDHPSQGAEQ
ncbi:DNA-binding transcriptional ArsR family regulator [Arthrobacter globiformis]|nr:DNA-binding transcriptional ArsR family regulator [Arthrobacter globiformis]